MKRDFLTSSAPLRDADNALKSPLIVPVSTVNSRHCMYRIELIAGMYRVFLFFTKTSLIETKQNADLKQPMKR